MKMTAVEFAKNLQKLGEVHENDEVSVFDTDWSRVCKEAASYILELERAATEYKEACTEWAEWYHEHEEAFAKIDINHVSKDINVIDILPAEFVERRDLE